MSNRSNQRTTARGSKGTPVGRPESLVGVFATLADQHDQIAALFDQLASQLESRAILWPQIRRELVAHEHSEVRELYPVLRRFEDTRALADHHDAEARALDALIARLDLIDIQSDDWIALLDQLVDTVARHAKVEEEGKIFPIAQRVIGETRAIELDAKLRATRQQLMEPH